MCVSKYIKRQACTIYVLYFLLNYVNSEKTVSMTDLKMNLFSWIKYNSLIVTLLEILLVEKNGVYGENIPRTSMQNLGHAQKCGAPNPPLLIPGSTNGNI